MPVMADESEAKQLYFQSPAGTTGINCGVSYWVLKTDAGLRVSEFRAPGIVGLLYAWSPNQYNSDPHKHRLSFRAFTGSEIITYLPTFPSHWREERPTLVSELYFDPKQKVFLYNKHNLADTLEFTVLENE